MSDPVPTLTESQAMNIVAVMDAAGQIEHPMPANAVELLAKGQSILKDANAAYLAGVKNPVILAILKISEEALDNENVVDNTTVVEESPVGETYNDSSEGTVAVNSDAIHLESDQEKEPSQREYLADEPWNDLPELPRDFSKSSDLDVRSLYAIRIALQSRVIFELGIEDSDYHSAQVSYELAIKRAIANAPESKVTEKRDAAYLEPEAMSWREKVSKHHENVVRYRSMKDVLENEIRGLSREWAMRSGERAAA